MNKKHLVNLAFLYAILAMAGGVFYREFTKFSGFEGRTSLAFVHVHLFMLGMFFFLILAILDHLFALHEAPSFKICCIVYNAGLVLTAALLITRGIVQVKAVELTSAASAAISGCAGLGHITLGVGVVWFFLLLRRRICVHK